MGSVRSPSALVARIRSTPGWAASRAARCRPTKPAAPVTRTRMSAEQPRADLGPAPLGLVAIAGGADLQPQPGEGPHGHAQLPPRRRREQAIEAARLAPGQTLDDRALEGVDAHVD